MSTPWISIKRKRPPKESGLILVTNNRTARDSYGKHSHVWITQMIHPQSDGTFAAYAEPSDRRVENLTHWRPAIPEEWE